MIAEIITIGDELLYGSRIDTNSAYLAHKLDSIGLDIRYKTTAGDNVEQLEDAVNLAFRRADVVITTGGLGPTEDDVTKKAICKVFKRNLIFHEDILANLQKLFSARGLKMPAINQNQALLPQGARFLANRTGSAVGIVIDEKGKFFCSMPGVNHEMKIMTDEELLPVLQSLTGKKVIARQKLRTVGIIESALAEKIRPALKFAEGVSLSYLPSVKGVDLCIKGIGTIEQEVESGVTLLADGIRNMAGKYIYSEDDRELEEVVGGLLAEKELTLASAESCTGGLLGGRITGISGASRYYLGGLVTYTNEAKVNLLGVSQEIIDRFGAVSAEAAKAMAKGVIKAFGADIGVSITGIAGPTGGTEDKPVGTIFLGLAIGEKSIFKKLSLGVDRQTNRERSVTMAIELIRRGLLGIG
jgi:nicotinamide-nucleotide amidase